MTDFYELTPDKQEGRYRQLAELALPEWGLEDASLSMIKMRENAVFRVDTSDGEKQVLRVHRANYHSDVALKSELVWIQALANAGVETPDVLPTLSGELIIVPDSKLAGLPRQIDMFAWVDGETLGDTEAELGEGVVIPEGNFETLGALAASVHNQASEWKSPEGFIRHAWDVDGLTGEQPFWGRFWEMEALSKEERSLMLSIRTRLREDLIAFGQSSENYSLIHADMLADNVLVDGDHIRLIDFDDAGFGWHLFEMATSLNFYQMEDQFEQLKDAYIRGYRSQRNLSDETLEYLPMFLLVRGTTYLGWAQSRKETETAQGMTPLFIEMACSQAEKYLST